MTYDTTTTQTRPGDAPGSRNSDLGLRTPLRILVVVLSLLAIAWGALTVASLLARGSGQDNGSYEGVSSIEIDSSFESVEVVGSADATAVSMHRSYHWSFRKPTVSTRQEGDVLRLTSSCTFQVGIGCTGRVRLVVPEDVALRMDISDGSATVRDLTGNVDLESSDGGINASDLTGRLSMRTSDGSLTATGLRSDKVDAVTSDGSVRLEFEVAPSGLTARTSDGSIQIAVPDDDTAYAVTGSTADGGRDIQVPTDPDATHRIDVTSSDGSVKVETRP